MQQNIVRSRAIAPQPLSVATLEFDQPLRSFAVVIVVTSASAGWMAGREGSKHEA